MKVKKKDILYCHTNCIMRDSGEIVVSKGNSYQIIDIKRMAGDMCLVIINDLHEKHGFTLETCIKYFTYPENIFKPIKHLKKFKL